MGPPLRLHVLPQLLQSPVRPEDGELSSHLPSNSCAVLFRDKRLEGGGGCKFLEEIAWGLNPHS